MARGRPKAPPPLLETRIENFLEMLAAERGASQNTLSSYQRDLVDAQKFCEKEGKKDLGDAETALLQKYLYAQHAAKKSSATVARRLSCLKQFFRFLADEKQRSDNPAQDIDAPKQGRKLPKYLREDEVMALLAALNTWPEKDRLRLTCLLEILYASGLRVSELVRLKLAQAQKAKDHLLVLGKGNKERLVPLTPEAYEALQDYLQIHDQFTKAKEKSPWLFPSPSKEGHLTRQRFGQMLKDIAIKAKIDPKRVSPHVLRHALATHLLAHGLDLRSVQQILGHADIATTQIYTHILPEQLVKTVDDHHPLSAKKSKKS